MINIPGFPKYVINREGSIWSTITNKYLKPQVDKRGYLTVKLEGKNKTIHRLMGYAYLGLTSDKTINHINGNKKDNRLENLEVCTNAENIKHAYDTGIRTNPYGEKARNVKLSNKDVETIRANLGTLTQRELAFQFGVHRSTIGKIKSRKNWSKV